MGKRGNQKNVFSDNRRINVVLAYQQPNSRNASQATQSSRISVDKGQVWGIITICQMFATHKFDSKMTINKF